MKLTVFTIGILISFILASICLAILAKVLSTKVQNIQKENSNPRYLKATYTYDNLIWFLQVSDIHISIFRDPVRITEFREFCHYTIDTIKPSLVLASGDLTDAKAEDNTVSEQYEGEWKHYRDILNETHVRKKTVWLDIRGNHDSFNVANQNSKQNFFANYSVQGRAHPRSYMYQMKSTGALYSFIGIDASLEPGPRIPFNFLGQLDDLEVQKINLLIKKAESTSTNYTIFFGHFPTSCILTSGSEDVRQIIGKHRPGLAYMCGHLHQLGGIVPKMYTMQQNGFLELELGDWKHNRVYRLVAIDHGLMSFTDVVHRDWPVILITNPKDALFVNTARENLETVKNSTHIRILVFSPSKIDIVRVKIDNGNWKICEKIKGPLYVVNWNAVEYLHGLHQIEVHVTDIEGRTKTIVQSFSLDGSKAFFNILAKVALMIGPNIIFRTIFLCLLIMSVAPLCLLRYIHNLVAEGKVVKPRLQTNYLFILIKKMWILSTVDKIFWVLVLYPIFLAVGPWSIGYLVEDHIGAVFAWGIFINGAHLPGSVTYEIGVIQIITFYIPLTIILAHVVNQRYHDILLKTDAGKDLPLLSKISFHLPFSLMFMIQVRMTYSFWLAYGTLSLILGPLRTWSLIIAIMLYYQALHLNEKNFKKATAVWNVLTDQSKNTDEVRLSPIEKYN